MTTDALSVILPTFKRPEQLRRQLSRLSEQDFAGEWEVVVCDNSPYLEARNVVRERDWGFVVHHLDASRRPGAAAARNLGASAAIGSRFAFVDDDDEVAAGWLAAMDEALGAADLVAGATYLVDGHPNCPTGTYGYRNYAIAANMGVRREVFETVAGFDEDMITGEDIDFSWRVQEHGYTLHQRPDALVSINGRETLAGTAKQHYRFGRGEVQLYARHRAFGMPRRPITFVRQLGWLITFGRLRGTPTEFCKLAAGLCGRIHESVRRRCLYLA
jgi:GT2 family glycosyltransferase